MDMKKKELRAYIERLERENSNIRGENNVLAVQVKALRETANEQSAILTKLDGENSDLKQVLESRDEDIKRAQNYDWKAVKKRCEEAERFNAEQAVTIKHLYDTQSRLKKHAEDEGVLRSAFQGESKEWKETAQQHKRHILALQEQNERHIENIRTQTILARAYRDRWLKSLER